MFVKRRNTANNSEKVLAIRLHDNSNMSAPEPTVKAALVIIYRLAVLMFYSFIFFSFVISQPSVAAKEGWKNGKGERNKITFVLSSRPHAVCSFLLSTRLDLCANSRAQLRF